MTSYAAKRLVLRQRRDDPHRQGEHEANDDAHEIPRATLRD
jgi:hypothetical protein